MITIIEAVMMAFLVTAFDEPVVVIACVFSVALIALVRKEAEEACKRTCSFRSAERAWEDARDLARAKHRRREAVHDFIATRKCATGNTEEEGFELISETLQRGRRLFHR